MKRVIACSATLLAAASAQTDCITDFAAGLGRACPDQTRGGCPRKCASYLSSQMLACPTLGASLSADDLAFIGDTCGLAVSSGGGKTDGPSAATGVYALSAYDIEGNVVSLSDYVGKVSLFVNVAQFWGLTDTLDGYMGMVQLHNQYKDRGFQVVGVPCNQFGGQEPNTNAVVENFFSTCTEAGCDRSVSTPSRKTCSADHSWAGCQFPMLAKSTVNDPMCAGSDDSADCSPTSSECCTFNNGIYEYFRGELPGAIPWNFAKFLVGPDGAVVKRYPSRSEPTDLSPDIEAVLATGRPAPDAGSGH